MPDYLFLMHDAVPDGDDDGDEWEAYVRQLQASGNFQGGSAIGDGICIRKSGVAPAITAHLSGYIRVSARDLQHAETLLNGNPVFERGGTVEIRELPRTD